MKLSFIRHILSCQLLHFVRVVSPHPLTFARHWKLHKKRRHQAQAHSLIRSFTAILLPRCLNLLGVLMVAVSGLVFVNDFLPVWLGGWLAVSPGCPTWYPSSTRLPLKLLCYISCKRLQRASRRQQQELQLVCWCRSVAEI